MNPVIGRCFPDPPVEIRSLSADGELVTVQGTVSRIETKELKNGEILLVAFTVTDLTASVRCRAFLRYRTFCTGSTDSAEKAPVTDLERKAVLSRLSRLREGSYVRVRGECGPGSADPELIITVRDLLAAEKEAGPHEL